MKMHRRQFVFVLDSVTAKTVFFRTALSVIATAAFSGLAYAQPVEVWMRAFIPDPGNASKAGTFIAAVPASDVKSVVKLQNISNDLNECFATDHRGFSKSASATARVETQFTVTLKGNSGIVSPANGRTKAAVTRKVDCASGAPIAQGAGVVNRDHLGTPAVADGIVQVIGQAQGTNNLTFFGKAAPSIDYSFDLKWKPSSGSFTAEVTLGDFPAFEVYARRPGGAWVAVIQHLPVGPPWKLAGDSFGMHSHRIVQTVTLP